MTSSSDHSDNTIPFPGNGASQTLKCPICQRPRQPEWRPFCSKRCADIDLGKWLNEDYKIPCEDHEESDSFDLPE